MNTQEQLLHAKLELEAAKTKVQNLQMELNRDLPPAYLMVAVGYDMVTHAPVYHRKPLLLNPAAIAKVIQAMQRTVVPTEIIAAVLDAVGLPKEEK